jgi:predicted phage terminase large subunit-like protein
MNKALRLTEIEREFSFRRFAKEDIKFFTLYTFADYFLSIFHHTYIMIIQAFVKKRIKKLIISIPPQHGKSEIATRRLPAFLIGRDPTLKIAIVSYSERKAVRFGRQIKHIMKSQEYKNIFPTIKLPERKDQRYTNSADTLDIPAGDKTGNMFFVGRGGGLTGEPVDILIMDDLYKNAMEAYSPITRDAVIDWYDTVADSRLHNDSQQIIVSTRWHEEDLIGYMLKTQDVIELKKFSQIGEYPDKWHLINFEALKESVSTGIDTRQNGEALYPEKHSKAKLTETKDRLIVNEPEKWESLYQGNPRPIKGLLYKEFKEYTTLPEIVERKAYIDVADTGDNKLCAICYAIGVDDYIYLLDIYHTVDPQEITEVQTAEMLIRNEIEIADIESNSGGRGFARNVKRILDEKDSFTEIDWFHQSKNKESRILTNAASVTRTILMPVNWQIKYNEFASDLLSFRKKFKANKYDDAADTITGVYEKSEIEEQDFAIGVV